MLVKLNKPLTYGGGILDKDAVVELPHELANNIIEAGNGENYVEAPVELDYVEDDDAGTTVQSADKNGVQPNARQVGRTKKRGGKN